MWLPDPEYAGYGRWDVSASLASGLNVRAIEETAAAALAWERQLGLDRVRRAGITSEEERSLLSDWSTQAAR